MEKLVNTHRMQSESGEFFEVYEYQDFIDAGTYEDPNAKIPGLKRLTLRDGSHVNDLGDGEFQIVATGAVLRMV